MEPVLFGILSVAALAGGVGVIASRNPVHSAIALLAVLWSLAVLYFLLLAPFVAVLQIFLYAGAILVLFLFVIMLVHGHPLAHTGEKLVWQRPLAVVLSALLVLFLSYASIHGLTSPRASPGENFGTVQEVGRALFTTYLLPFELASVILLVAIVAAVVLGKPVPRGAETLPRPPREERPLIPAGTREGKA
ncbi:MAG: NADH-quinone oxidoreductase subunit J [Armatimonadota bacterium]|nr:NADH-quinone oxidoreductase subunit J [Armatimonadota bacterium]MDR5702464.1 NADH-quinone oxidoreductase subunit J [Armatimonadota bacterium]MDR7433563.1 NADH-quinone oxidoreductase subunit J [Armatimonadota bacterium]